MAAANAPGLQLAGGLLAAGVLGKMLLQVWHWFERIKSNTYHTSNHKA